MVRAFSMGAKIGQMSQEDSWTLVGKVNWGRRQREPGSASNPVLMGRMCTYYTQNRKEYEGRCTRQNLTSRLF